MSFGRRIPPPTPAEAEREAKARAIGCICCYLNAQRGRARAPSHDTKQHCNLGGRHGAPNRGERYTFIACAWHHQGVLPIDRGYTTTTMTALYGPSLAKGTKPFRLEYGTDDELIALTDQLTGFQPCPITAA